MNKDGNNGIGIYANGLSGKNIAVYSELHLKAGLAPIIDNKEYNNLQVFKDDKSTSKRTPGRESELIEYNISKKLSSAVDNAKAPDMFFRNDNLLTSPINTLFDSLGINEFTTHDYLNQPIIKMLTKVYQDGEYTPNMLYEAASSTWEQYLDKYDTSASLNMPFSELTDFGFSDMFTEKLQNISEENINHEDQLGYLNSFLSFHKTGRELTSAYVVLNQDKGADQASFGGLLSFKGRRNVLLQNDIVKGFDSVLDGTSYPLQAAYKTLIDQMLNFGSEFFIHNKRSVVKTKATIATLLNKENLTDVDHRTIEDAMLLYMMSKNDSPLSSIFTDSKINELLRGNKTNLFAKLQKLKLEFPELNENAFIKNVVEHPENIKEGSLLTRVKFQNIYSFTKSEVDSFIRSFGNLMVHENPQIREIANDFISVSLLTNGFTPSHDSFIDIIPVEALKRSSNYFYDQFDLLDNIEYFDNDFAHDFVRNFYYTDIVNNIRVSKNVVNSNVIKLNWKDSRIYSKNLNKTVDYFTVSNNQGTKLFVKNAEVGNDVFYERSTTKGIPHGLKEINIKNSEGIKIEKSVIQSNYINKSNTKPGLARIHENKVNEAVADNEDAIKRCINIT